MSAQIEAPRFVETVVGRKDTSPHRSGTGKYVWVGKFMIRGNYTLVGSTCEPTGTAYLSPWEY